MTTPTPCACPFCGSDNTWTRPEVGGFRVTCNDCTARGEHHQTNEAAVLSWNRVSRMPVQLEETRRALQALADRMHQGVL